MEAVELADVVMGLRRELERALRDGEDDLVRFSVGPIELELEVVVTRETASGGKVRFWVFEAGADMTTANMARQRVRFVLDPTVRGERSLRISGE